MDSLNTGYNNAFGEQTVSNNNQMTDVSQLFDGVPAASPNSNQDLSQLFDETPAQEFSIGSDKEIILAKIEEINQRYQARIDDLLKEKDEMINGIIGDLFVSKTNDSEQSMANEVSKLFD